MPRDKLKIIPVQSRRELKTFIKLPYRLYQKDPHWIPPLYLERKEAIHPKKNPFYQHAAVQLFLALKGNQPVGRISAQIDHEYEKFHGERVGHFGFFESEDDPEIARGLFERAEAFLRQEHAPRILGPFSFSINEECGLLIEGFDKPLMTMMPYNPPYYASLIEGSGFHKVKDLLAWYYKVGDIPEGPTKIADSLAKHPGLVVRPLNKKRFREDLGKIMEIYSSAWSKNWGFVPPTPAEVDKIAKDLKVFMDPEVAYLAEIDGKPAAMCLAIPNLYELVKGLHGRLFPLGIFRFLWRIKRRKAKNGRLMLLGIKEEYRKSTLGALSILLYVEIHRRCLRQGYDFGELSWTLEDNQEVNMGIEFMGGKRYKTYRVYEKKL